MTKKEKLSIIVQMKALNNLNDQNRYNKQADDSQKRNGG